jgi:hypothetical protein
VTRSYVPAPPWKVPTAGFVPLYENVHVRLSVPACDRMASINFREPAKVGTVSVARTDQSAHGDLSVSRPCVQPHVTTVTFGVPLLVTFFARPGAPTAEDCVRVMTDVLKPDTGYSFSSRGEGVPDDQRLAECAVLPADPEHGRTGAVVSLDVAYVSEGVADVTLSAWTGTDEVAVLKATEQTPPASTSTPPEVAPPFREKYRDVRLHVPGKPEACGDQTYLDLHVPEVNHSLALSDAALTRPCPDPGAASLQLGGDRGVVLDETGLSAGACAGALELPRVDTFQPVEGTTLCIVSPADAEQHRPAVLVALTVTKVDARTGGFDLSATGWTGKAG